MERASATPVRATADDAIDHVVPGSSGAMTFPEAPALGRCARGNGGRHLLWIDPVRDLVIASHWGDGVGQLLAEVSASLTTETAP